MAQAMARSAGGLWLANDREMWLVISEMCLVISEMWLVISGDGGRASSVAVAWCWLVAGAEELMVL